MTAWPFPSFKTIFVNYSIYSKRLFSGSDIIGKVSYFLFQLVHPLLGLNLTDWLPQKMQFILSWFLSCDIFSLVTVKNVKEMSCVWFKKKKPYMHISEWP